MIPPSAPMSCQVSPALHDLSTNLLSGREYLLPWSDVLMECSREARKKLFSPKVESKKLEGSMFLCVIPIWCKEPTASISLLRACLVEASDGAFIISSNKDVSL